ncbi:hypothetical protein C5C74_08280 [Rathayibacter sp. AY1E8]|uniref:hypothetical protein n=1 Tax=Rathayibacter sp. AY1E8 TaxID=2080555 RepID=UPI000CE81D41|nr:hypothetical protein [Rathayibacter sp. AY1E8]PPG18963.1 hypothetical protein C5C74_08280 [Rathayibacter sp. AY1E8]
MSVDQTTKMSRLPSTLNEKQVEILRWVEEGCPSEWYPDGFAHRITARALDTRGYVRVLGRGPSWSAMITPAGREWLEQHAADSQGLPSAEADELYARVRAADGLLELEDDADESMYQRLVDEYLESPSRERGKKMILRRSWYFSRTAAVEIVGVFEEIVPHGYAVVADEGRVRHPLAKAFLADPRRSFVTPDHMARAARVLEAAIEDAASRGWEVLMHAQSEEWRRDTWRAGDAHFDVQAAEARYAVQIREISAQGGKPIPYGASSRGPAWIGGRTTEFVSTGRLELRLFGRLQDHDGTPFREVKRPLKPMGLVIDELMRAIAITELELEERRQQEERTRRRQQAQWEAIYAQAITQHEEAARVAELSKQVERWTQAEELRAYVDAAERKVLAAAPKDLREWLRWARGRADALDPLQHPDHLVPVIPPPSAEDLRPFMHGLDPHGPPR